MKRLENCVQIVDSFFDMKSHFLLTTIAAVVLVGCSTKHTSLENIFEAIERGNIEIVKWHLSAGVDVNVKDGIGVTPLHFAVLGGHKELAELLIANGADVNLRSSMVVKTEDGSDGEQAAQEITALDRAIGGKHMEVADLLRKHGAKTAEELKAAGN